MQQHAVDLALENAGFDQAEKRLEQHFADAVKACIERPGFLGGDRYIGRQPLHDGVKLRIIAVAQYQPLRQRIADLADADLQRAAVAHQARGVQADGVFGIGDRLGRRREQRKIGLWTIEHRAEFIAGQIPRTRHERQLRIDLGDQFERGAAVAAGAHHVQRGVGVAAQAVARDAIDHALCHQLGNDVEPARQQIGRGMGVVGGDVVLLRERHMQPASSQKEKLDHLDIRRQRAGMQRVGIGQIRIATEQAVDHRRDEAPLQQVRRPRLFQRQRGKEREVDRTIGAGARVERVGDVIGLAKPERQPDHQIGPDIADDVLRDRLGVGEHFGHEDSGLTRSEAPAWNRA